ncbi:MAG: transposase [Myxococcales bacterium]|nr:transposase [Myxococcales bacterium]
MQLIAESHDPALRALYLARSEKLSAELLAFGASDDHVHLAVRMALTRSIAEVARAFKSESAVVLARRLEDPNLPRAERLRGVQHRSRQRDAAVRLHRTPARAPSHRRLARCMGAHRARRRVQRVERLRLPLATRELRFTGYFPGACSLRVFFQRGVAIGPADAEPAPRSEKAGRSSPGRAPIACFLPAVCRSRSSTLVASSTLVSRPCANRALPHSCASTLVCFHTRLPAVCSIGIGLDSLRRSPTSRRGQSREPKRAVSASASGSCFDTRAPPSLLLAERPGRAFHRR